MSPKYFALTVILALIAGNAFTGFLYFQTKNELLRAQATLSESRQENKALIFLDLLISKVLQNNGEVSFDDRLRLENAVRDVDDPAILEKWTKFSNSGAEDEAQENVKELLISLVKKAKDEI